MLVLSRKIGESLIIDGGITVTILSSVGGKIRLGIVAPPSIRVDREEIHERRVAEERHSEAWLGSSALDYAG